LFNTLKSDAEAELLHDPTHFRRWLEGMAKGRHIAHNHTDLQDFKSNTCGEWAVVFCRAGVLPTFENKHWRPLLGGTPVSRDALVRKRVGIV